MTKLPTLARTHREIEHKIHRALEDERAKRQPRDRLSMSELGRCVRDLWAQQHGIPDERPPAGQAFMAFDVGSALEPAIVGWLKKAGYQIAEKNGAEQWRVAIRSESGAELASGRLDGLILWGNPRDQDWRLIEVKTAKAKRFDALVEAGSYRAWNPDYFDQVQSYMGASHEELDMPSLEDCLVVVACKDDARLWCEMIRFDPLHYAAIQEKAAVALGDAMPNRPALARGKSSKFCRWCARKDWCYGPLAGVEFDD